VRNEEDEADEDESQNGFDGMAGEGESVGMEPSARFLMPENECRITIRFHPPV
jgi:hypothetical protein